MRDNQNRDLEATKKWQAIEAENHKAGTARMEKALQDIKSADWTEIDGVAVLRIEDSKFVAVPVTGQKNSRKFDIINVGTREFVCQVGKDKVRSWLVKAS